jgi:hypothetical protein
MIKKIFLVLACLAPIVTSAVEQKNIEIFIHANTEALRRATDKYLNFINLMSKGSSVSQAEVVPEIISPKCKKILNGQLYTQNSEEFVNDLRSVYENQGAWEIYPADIIIDPSSNTVVLRLFIEMEKLGVYTAIVILRYDSDYLITEINEVLNQVKGSYDFKRSS